MITSYTVTETAGAPARMTDENGNNHVMRCVYRSCHSVDLCRKFVVVKNFDRESQNPFGVFQTKMPGVFVQELLSVS